MTCLLQKPVWKSSVANFTMRPRSDARIDVHAVFLAEFNEMPQVAFAGPIELAFDLFVMDPDNVGSNDGYPSGLHFQDFFFPLRRGDARVMEFTHYGKPGLSVHREVATVHAKNATVKRCRGSPAK